MNLDFASDEDWASVVDRLGGADELSSSARSTKAFERSREIKSATQLLRLVLAYCVGKSGLRVTSAWAAAIGLADISNVALLKRLRKCGDWLELLVALALAKRTPCAVHGRLIRLIDATCVPKAGAPAKRGNGVWRIHSAFDLPSERFSAFEVTEETGSERLDRIAVVKGEIRIADRVHLQVDQIASVLDAGGDVVVRAGWKSARWLQSDGTQFDLTVELDKAKRRGLKKIDQPIWLARKEGPALGLRLVALLKPDQAAEAARRNARRAAQRGGNQISDATLIAADWLILITSLPLDTFCDKDITDLYRLRWRVELAFKRLKSLIGLNGPPATDKRSAKPYVLAHLLIMLLVEPILDELDVSPHWDHDID
jgi:Transposase DDE domain